MILKPLATFVSDYKKFVKLKRPDTTIRMLFLNIRFSIRGMPSLEEGTVDQVMFRILGHVGKAKWLMNFQNLKVNAWLLSHQP